MEWGQQMKLHQETSKLSLYHNSDYNYERIEQKRIIVDVNMSISGTLDCVQEREYELYKNCSNVKGLTKFRLELCEPLIIDALSDVYLESFMTWNGLDQKSASGSDMAYILNIQEFCNNDTNYGTNIYTSNYIPNPNYNCNISCTPSNASQILNTTFDCKKTGSILIPVKSCESNIYSTHICDCDKYISSINPIRITELNGTITDNGTLYNTPCGLAKNNDSNIIYNSAFTKDYGRFIATFIIKKRCYC
jgi:hypothetical protein